MVVKFVNQSSDQVFLYRPDGSVLKVLEPGKRWNRDPKEDTLGTAVVAGDMKFPPPRPQPHWVEKTEWTWADCPEDSVYAPYRSITFLDHNQVKLRRRPFWKLPEMKWPVVTFLFKSHKMQKQIMRLERDLSSFPVTFYNGIPCRRTVSPLSKYAPYKNWFFDEQKVLRDANPPYKQMVEAFEIIEYGKGKRSAAELEEIAELKRKEEERKNLALG